MLKNVAKGLSVIALGLAFVAGCGGGGGKMAHGADLFRTCTPCHGSNGAGDLALRTPAIAGLPSWYIARELTKFQTDVRGAHPDDMEGHRMRPMARTLWRRGDVEAVAAYVASLPPVPSAPTFRGGDVAKGQARYTTVCIACHMPDGKGNDATGAPKLAGQWDWYMISQLRKFQSGWRGTNAADTTGAQMRAMAMTLMDSTGTHEDSTAMHDVVAYIKTLPAR